MYRYITMLINKPLRPRVVSRPTSETALKIYAV